MVLPDKEGTMKTMTARYFAEHASAIGKNLMNDPKEIYLVTNKTNPLKNFVCISLEKFREIGNIKDVVMVDREQNLQRLERASKSRKMSRTYWDNIRPVDFKTGTFVTKFFTGCTAPRREKVTTISGDVVTRII